MGVLDDSNVLERDRSALDQFAYTRQVALDPLRTINPLDEHREIRSDIRVVMG